MNIEANGIDFYYEIHGEGQPLLLLEGLGYGSWMWYKQVKELSKHFKVIIIDNRGVGYTDKPDEEYSIEMFADDAAAVLTKLGITKAHILGVSMGGFIAQQFAVSYPKMVDKLILCSTSFGGPNSVPIPPDTLRMMMNGEGGETSSASAREAVSVALHSETSDKNAAIIDWIIKSKAENAQPKYAYQRQLMAGASFNGENWTSSIKAETLILAGKGDRVVPYQNAEMLNEKIISSRLEIIDKGGHVFFMEEPEKTNQLIVDFLTEPTDE
ncbi:alpha/beta hydrolase [Paraliobacillus quinghaiensis]|uniref:Alpha/beta hydrolase n=1 Tax=Paraliobacillus quinghaiensis TaxID=470815 RepID=A0A917WYM0_9BACI|nr:alpha/beta hydrolase [Paraliobacillus quinghaiensis]GGM42080.1 alpha/beta hydrolase [Paraliobacillus quinghaiensis]